MKRKIFLIIVTLLTTLSASPVFAAVSDPTNVKATSTPGTATAKIAWTAPSGATQYKVRAFIGNVAVKSEIVGTRTSHTFHGLEYAISYVLKVQASDGSSWSNVVSATAIVPEAASPSAPTTPVASVIADKKIKVGWEAPSNDGGSPVNSYIVQVQKDGEDFGEPIKTPSLSHTFETSDTESTYTVRVQAVNEAGKESPQSEPSEGKIPVLTAAAIVATPPLSNGNNPTSGGGNSPTSGGGNSPTNQSPTIDQTTRVVSPSPNVPAYTKVIKTKATTSSKTLVSLSKLATPKGSKTSFVIATSSKKYCQLTGSSVKSLRAGTCSVKVTVTTKTGKKSSRTVKLIAR